MDDLGFGALGVEDHAEDVFEKERMQDDDDCVMVDEVGRAEDGREMCTD